MQCETKVFCIKDFSSQYEQSRNFLQGSQIADEKANANNTSPPLFSGIISMALMYYFGPPSNERSFNLIQWGQQAIAVYMIYQSTYWKAFAITVVVVLVVFQFISFTNMFKRIVCFL